MGDSWEDEDFEDRLPPPVPLGATSAASAPANWDDEEDLVEIDAPMKAVQLTAEQLAAKEKKARDAEIAHENKLKVEMLKKETPEERKARERKAAEESDNALAGELFGTGAGAGSSSMSSSRSAPAVVLKTKQDHAAYGTTISQKLAASSAFNIAAFYKSLSKTCEHPDITSAVLAEIIGDLTKIRDKKLEKEKPAPQTKVAKKSKKQLAKEQAAIDDKFGAASSSYNDYDDYADMEDSFM